MAKQKKFIWNRIYPHFIFLLLPNARTEDGLGFTQPLVQTRRIHENCTLMIFYYAQVLQVISNCVKLYMEKEA